MPKSLFSGVPEEDVRALLSSAPRCRFTRGETVFHRGDPAESMHLITVGRFAAHITTALGDTAALAVLGRGEVFGEQALVLGGHRSATVAALEPAETRRIDRRDFNRLRASQPALTELLLKLLAARVEQLSARVVEALYAPAEDRIVHRLEELAAIYDEGADHAAIPLRQEQLAQLAGTSRVTANQVLQALQVRGAVELGRGKVVVRPGKLPRRHRI